MSLMQGITAGIGGIGMLSGLNSGKQIETQQKLTDQQVEAQKKLGKFNADQALMMWDKTNYASQVEQMKKAGLSVSTMMGKGGGGGMTASGGEAGSVTGGQAETPSQGLMAKTAVAQQMANLSLLNAQKENIEADTKNKLEDAGNKSQDKITKEFDNKVRETIGTKEYSDKILTELNAERVKNKNEFRMTSALMDALEEGSPNELSITIDKFGQYQGEGNYKKLGKNQANYLISEFKQLEANINKINQDIKESKQSVNESKSKENLNKIEAEINSFKADLSGMGLNETTTKILDLMLRAMLGIRGK